VEGAAMPLAGLVPFGAVPAWVKLELAPGGSSQISELGWKKTLRSVLSLSYFHHAPNLVWFVVALALHVGAPYDISGARDGWALEPFLQRLALNFGVAGLYYSFFYVALYHLSWAKRKFKPGSYPTMGNMAHNLWYWSLGVLQWTAWECVMTRLWATGMVPFVSDAQLLASPALLAWNALWVLIVPLWRDLHFYVAHRFIHIRAVYRFVHSLHHRCTDPEPFSGMTMHPVEHLYYFSNALVPTLYLSGLSPLVFQWIFVHLSLAPGAGHSGWEDHFQADQYHYVHHAKFECNYGSPFSGFIDQWCGTFRERLGESVAYRGEWVEPVGTTHDGVPRRANTARTAAQDGAAQDGAAHNGAAQDDAAQDGTTYDGAAKAKGVWAKDAYLGLPADKMHATYTLFSLGLAALFAHAAVSGSGDSTRGATRAPTSRLQTAAPTAVAAAVAYGPVVVALALCALSGDRISWRWPFHKERVFGQFGLFLVLGWLACLLPVFHAAQWVCIVAA